MRNLFFSLLFVSNFQAVFTRNDFPNEVVVTSADLVNGRIENIGTVGQSYRLYAIFPRYIGQDETITKQITITDSQGKVFRLNEFHQAGVDNYFLSEDRIVVGPLTVRDPTPSPLQKSNAYKLPYTIYIVSTKVPALPVADAFQWSNSASFDSDRNNGQEVHGVTFLSADEYFTLRQFNFTADSAFVIPRGYDLLASGAKDSVMDLNQDNAYASYLTIFGPIATIVNNDPSKTGRFQLKYDAISTWGGITVGSALTLLSPNWLSLDNSYSTTWMNYGEALDRQFEYGKDTLLDFSISASLLKAGESVTVEIKDQSGEKKQWSVDSSNTKDIRDSAFGTSLRMTATVTTPSNPSTYPRFIVKVTSGASTSFSLLLLAISLCLYLLRCE